MSARWLAIAVALSLTPAPARPQAPVRLAAVGDIACSPADVDYNGGLGTAIACRMKDTSDLALAGGYDAVLLLGDNQYDSGALPDYMASFDPTWGRLKAITKPVPGNHEYITPGGSGYYQYFGTAAGDPQKGYYSFDLGAWHLVVLNSNCAEVGGCDLGSPQNLWLRADLAASAKPCTLAAWHHPRFSSGPHGNDPSVEPLWRALAETGADLILTGHDHLYERFAPQTATGVADPTNGIRQITAGTGGRSLYAVASLAPNSVALGTGTFGFLELTLRADRYDWTYRHAAGTPFADSGSALCHRRPLGFHTLAPCRILDTRNPNGPQGGPPLAAGQTRTVPVAGLCGVPADAVAIAANLSVVAPAQIGNLRAGAAGSPLPGTSALNFRVNRTRTNNATVELGPSGDLALRADLASGSVHVVLDVVGFFR